jgi:transposase
LYSVEYKKENTSKIIIGSIMKERDEALYNLAQENEVFIFFEFLPKVVESVCKNYHHKPGVGAPPAKLYDILMNLGIKNYFSRSLRRSKGLIRLMKYAFKLKFKVLSFKTVDKYLNDPCVRIYQDQIIEYTSNPLKFLEKNFATDKTGERTKTFSSWYSLRCNKQIQKRDHINIHITTGSFLHSVAAIDVLAEKGKDNLIFREHVQELKERDYKINLWSGDGVYLARENCTAVQEAGGKPRFHLKKGLTKKSKGHPAWKQMLYYAEEHPEEYDSEYHTRSNVECTNSAKKRKFGDSVRSKNDTAQENESQGSWCCYNFTVLSRAYYELGIEPNFD